MLIIWVDINSNNTIRQRTSSNATDGGWRDGSLDKANLKAYDADRVTVQACWAGTPDEAAMRLWYASGNATLEEYMGRQQS